MAINIRNVGESMIIQPERSSRNVNDLLYEAERRRIDTLNQEFFQDIQLTKVENDVLVWLCGWDEWTINAMMAVFRKIRSLSNVKTEA